MRIQQKEFGRSLHQGYSQKNISSIWRFAFDSIRHRFRYRYLFCLSFPICNSSAFTYSLHRSKVLISFPIPAFYTTLSSEIMAPKVMSDTVASTEMDDTNSSPSSRRKRNSAAQPTGSKTTKKRRNVAKKDNDPSITPEKDSETSPSSVTKTKKEKAVSHQVLTDRDALPKLWNDDLAKANGSCSK
jgi:hypothetical protein